MSAIAEQMLRKIAEFRLTESSTVTVDNPKEVVIHMDRIHYNCDYRFLLALQQVVKPSKTADDIVVFGCGDGGYNIFVTI